MAKIDISKIPQIAARLGTGFVPEGVLWEALNSNRSIDDIIVGYEYEFEESGTDIPSWLDDWDMGDSAKVREAINVITGVQEADVFGVGGPTNENVARAIDINPELMEIADLVEQGIIDMGGDTDDFDIFMDEMHSAMNNIDDKKVNSIIELMDASSENTNPEAVLANIKRLLLSAEEDILKDADPDPDLVPDPNDEADYGGYDNTSAYGAMVRHAIDYKDMSLEEAKDWALGKAPPNIAGASITGGLPTPDEAQDWMDYSGGKDESDFGANLPVGAPGSTKSMYSRQPGDQLSYFTGESIYDEKMTTALEVWDEYFRELPEDYETYSGVPDNDKPSYEEFVTNKLTDDLKRLNDSSQSAYIFTWLYKNAQDPNWVLPSVMSPFPSNEDQGMDANELAGAISQAFSNNKLTETLQDNEILFYATDLFTQDSSGSWLFPTVDVIRTHNSLNPSAQGQAYYENLIDAGRDNRDIFDKAFRQKHQGLDTDWYSQQKNGLFQDAMLDRYFQRWDEDASVYSGFSEGWPTSMATPFAVDDEWLQDWLEDPYAHQTALFSNVTDLAKFLDKNSWGAFQGEDYARLLGQTTSDESRDESFYETTKRTLKDIDEKIAGNLNLDLTNSSQAKLFQQYKAFNPLLYKAGSREYDSAVQMIKQAAISALIPVGATPQVRSSMTKQISRDYDDFTSEGKGSPLSFLNHVLSGGRIVSTKSKFHDPATMDFTNPTLRLPGVGPINGEGPYTAETFKPMFEF